MTTRVVIVEDEPIARRQLRDLLGDVEWIVCIGEAANIIRQIGFQEI